MCGTLVWVGGPGRALFAAQLRRALGQPAVPPPFGRVASAGGAAGLAAAVEQQHAAERAGAVGVITEPVDGVAVPAELEALRAVVAEYLWRPADAVVWVGSAGPPSVREGVPLLVAAGEEAVPAALVLLREGGVWAVPPALVAG